MDTVKDGSQDNPELVLLDLANNFATLLAKSGLPEANQQNIIDGLPSMEIEEMLDLYQDLEAQYVSNQSAVLDVQFKQKLADSVEEFEQKNKEIDEDFLAKLAEFEKTLE